MEGNVSTFFPVFQFFTLANNGIMSFHEYAWVCPGCVPRSGVAGLGECISFIYASVSFKPLCPNLAIMGISEALLAPRVRSGNVNHGNRNCWTYALSTCMSVHSELGWVCLSVNRGLWSRCSPGTVKINLLNWDLKPAVTSPAMFWGPTSNIQLPCLYFFFLNI